MKGRGGAPPHSPDRPPDVLPAVAVAADFFQFSFELQIGGLAPIEAEFAEPGVLHLEEEG